MYTVLRSDEFDKWLTRLKDAKGKARIVARIRSAELGNLGDVKPAGEGISEMRIHYAPDTGCILHKGAGSLFYFSLAEINLLKNGT
jgi:putative addiction module killer protein